MTKCPFSIKSVSDDVGEKLSGIKSGWRCRFLSDYFVLNQSSNTDGGIIENSIECGKKITDQTSSSCIVGGSGGGNHSKEVARCRQCSLLDLLRKQVFYVHCCKLLALFTIALMHIFYLHPFLTLFSILENYSNHLEAIYHAESLPFRQQMVSLVDYKNNVWMLVGVSSLALSTSTFFLFLPALTSIRKSWTRLLGIIDMAAFCALPLLLWSRAIIIEDIENNLFQALESAHRIASLEKLMNDVKCTIFPRENLPFCSDVIIKSIFPTLLIKYLLIICVLTIMYGIVVYVTYWCLKHSFPPGCYQQTQTNNNVLYNLNNKSMLTSRSRPVYSMPLIVPNPSRNEQKWHFSKDLNGKGIEHYSLKEYVPAEPIPQPLS